MLVVLSVLTSCRIRSRFAMPVLLGVVLAVYGYACTSSASQLLRLNLVSVEKYNQVLLLEAVINRSECFFMLDTGYAGAPVLSTTYLALPPSKYGEMVHKYADIVNTLRTAPPSEDDRFGAVGRFIQQAGCYDFTSGCMMRLMSIGDTTQKQSDMLMCPMLELKNTAGHYVSPRRRGKAHADVFVTNALPSSVHILTCDYLLHSAPCLISISRGTLELSMPTPRYLLLKATYISVPAQMSGGAFVVPITVGGVVYRCTVDTGAPGPICLGASAASRLKSCSLASQSLSQVGVNGENVCSDMLYSHVEFCGYGFDKALVFANGNDLEQVDGYVGLAFLRAFDMLLAPNAISFQRNGLKMLDIEDFRDASNARPCPNSKLKCRASAV